MDKTNNNAKVSIVLPVYNGESTIENAISSVLYQTYDNWELIIVNDCSTDSTARIIKKYAEHDPRIKIINNSVNLKLPRALNAGFKAASGDYFTWTSDDNLYKENAIVKMIDVLTDNPDYDMVYADYTNIDAYGNILYVAKLGKPTELLKGNVIGACFLYTRKIAEKVGEYDANLFLAEDYDYWLRIWRAGNIMHIEDNLYCYRRHADSLSETKKQLIGLQTYKALEKNFLFMYSMSKTKKERYALFDQMIFRAGASGYAEAMDLLCNVDVKYLWHECIKKIKEKIYDLLIGIKHLI